MASGQQAGGVMEQLYTTLGTPRATIRTGIFLWGSGPLRLGVPSGGKVLVSGLHS